MKVLVVVDMQNDFITGTLGTKEAQAIVPNVEKKISETLKACGLVIFTRDTHSDDYMDTKEGIKLPVEHCIIDTEGWQICDELAPFIDHGNSFVVDKYTFGCYDLPELLVDILPLNGDRLECDEIELVGLCTDICVVSNALLLKSYFYDDIEISVDATCCAGVTPESHEAALKTMEMCQINIRRD